MHEDKLVGLITAILMVAICVVAFAGVILLNAVGLLGHAAALTAGGSY